jgi:hypothetical protein
MSERTKLGGSADCPSCMVITWWIDFSGIEKMYNMGIKIRVAIKYLVRGKNMR